jgi:hypothetical protein
MKKTVWGIAAGAAIGTVVASGVLFRKTGEPRQSCAQIGTKPFQGIRTPVAGVGTISEGGEGQYLIPYLSFDKAGGSAGTYKGMLWTGEVWRPLTVGAFHATDGVFQLISLRGSWYGFTNRATARGAAQLPTMYVGDKRGVFGVPQAIGVFSSWGEFDSAAKTQTEDRIGITGRDRLGGGFTSVFAEKIGDAPWVSEPILVDGKATPEAFSSLISYDRSNKPWVAYESRPGRQGNQAAVLTRTDQGWKLVSVSSRDPVNLVGAYMPPSSVAGERIALAWVEKNSPNYHIKTAILDLATQRLTGEREVARVGLGGVLSPAPLPAITVSHDGERAAITLVNPRTHQGWTSRLANGVFEPLRSYPVPQGQGVIGFPQAFYTACGDLPVLLVGVGRPAVPGRLLELGASLRVEMVSER